MEPGGGSHTNSLSHTLYDIHWHTHSYTHSDIYRTHLLLHTLGDIYRTHSLAHTLRVYIYRTHSLSHTLEDIYKKTYTHSGMYIGTLPHTHTWRYI